MGAGHPDSVSLSFRVFVAVNIGIRAQVGIRTAIWRGAGTALSRVRPCVPCRRRGRWGNKSRVKVKVEVCVASALAFIGIGRLRSGAHVGSLATGYSFIKT